MTVSGDGARLGVHGISQTEVDRILAENSTDEFEKLRGVPGYCIETMPWPEACKLVEIGTFEALGTLGRHPSHIVVYRRFKDKILQDWASMADYVSASILGFPTRANAEGKTEVVRPVSLPAEPQIIWRPNDFPYNLKAGIEHHNIWSTRQLSAKQIEEVIAQHRQGWDCVWFVNPEGLASIPTVTCPSP